MTAGKSVRRAEPIASETVRRAERFCLQPSVSFKIYLACLCEYQMSNAVFGELPSLPKQAIHQTQYLTFNTRDM